MNVEIKYDANYIKALLIDYYILNHSNLTIGCEVMYGTEKRLVDMLILMSGHTIAIEIKSKYDSFARLEQQMNEYCKVFDYVYLAIDETYISKLSNCDIPNNVGILSISKKGKLNFNKRALIQKGIQKKELLYTVNIKFIKNYFSDIELKGDSDVIRNLLLKKSKKTIEALFYAFLFHKIEPRYNTFISQRGKCTHIDDLFLLSYPPKQIL